MLFSSIYINLSRWTLSILGMIYGKLIAWFELRRGRRVSRRMARCLARLYAL